MHFLTSKIYIGIEFASKISDILYLFHMIERFIYLHTWKHHMITCLTLGIVFLKYMQVAEESSQERTHSKSFFLNLAFNEAIIP